MSKMKLMVGFRISMATLMFAGLFTHSAYAQEMKYLTCKGKCLAQIAVKNLKSYPLDIKSKLSDPLGSDVCAKQLKGNVTKIKGVDVCQFKDQSAVDLTSLHLYSERFAVPTP